MADDLEAFLRRAAQKRQQQNPPAARPAPRPQEPRLQPGRRSLASQPPPELILDAEVIEEDAEDISAHVSRHLNTDAFAERASHLGETTGLADDRMEAHLSEVFDHHIGKLDHEHTEHLPYEELTQKKVNPWLAFFRSPQDVRRAIVMAEVLRRPEF